MSAETYAWVGPSRGWACSMLMIINTSGSLGPSRGRIRIEDEVVSCPLGLLMAEVAIPGYFRMLLMSATCVVSLGRSM